METSNKFEPKICPRCGAMVPCTGDLNCWCMKVEVPEKVLDYISATYDGCLCRSCLEKIIEEKNIPDKND